MPPCLTLLTLDTQDCQIHNHHCDWYQKLRSLAALQISDLL